MLTYHDLTVEVETSAGKELLDHMHSTVMGQPGGLRYHHTSLEDRLQAPGENYFMYLRKGGKMLGSVGFRVKPFRVEDVDFDTWLIRYFSIKAPMRTLPTKRKEAEKEKDQARKASLLNRFIIPYSENPGLLREGNDGSVDPGIIYAIIDTTNLRSMNFSSEMGLETVGTVAGFSFSRMRPSASERINQLAEDEQDLMRSRLEEFYRDYTLFFPDQLFQNNDYYVIKRGGEIVAGIQIFHVAWNIVDFGSKLANRLVKLLGRFRWINKRLDPDHQRLLAYDGIYVKEGHEADLYELMEGVLERTGTYLGMVLVDTRSSLYPIFTGRGRLGILHRILGTHMAEVRVRFVDLPEKVRTYFLEHPAYIPTYDNS